MIWQIIISARKLGSCSLRSIVVIVWYRWLENVPVISRIIIEILPKLRNKSPRYTKAFQTVKEALGNLVFPMILDFSRSLAMEFQPFLSIFQADYPLSVFLCEKLKGMLHVLY